MAEERLICGFEKSEMVAKKGSSWTAIEDCPGGFKFVAWFEEGAGDRVYEWRCIEGDSSEGASALVAKIGPVTPPTTYKPTAYHTRHYPAIWVGGKPWKGGQAHRIFSTWQWLVYSDCGLTDWTGFDRLRVDVKAVSAGAKLWLSVEDDEIEPPVTARYTVPRGKWATIELDLDRAAAERGMNLADVVNFWLLGTARKETEVLVDNVRVCTADSPTKLEVIRDETSFALAPRKARKSPKRPAIPRGTERAKGLAAGGSPRQILDGSVVPFGFIGAFDDDRIILGRTIHGDHLLSRPEVSPMRKQAAVVTQSTDGGVTWTELPDPTWRNLDHGSARGSIIDGRGEAVVLSSGPGCAGVGRPTPRQHLTKYTFTGSGWEPRFPAAIVDSDIRHCGSNFSCVRLSGGANKGMLWGAWGNVDRKRTLDIHVACSDDDGVTWWPWGASGRVPGSREGLWTVNTYAYQQPRICEWGDGIAVFWQDRRGLMWTAYDGSEWSPVEVLDETVSATLAITGNESFRVPGCVVSGGGRIYLTAWNIPGVMVYDGGGWSRELPDADDGGVLSIAGKRTVLVTSGHVEEPPAEKRPQITRQASILARVRTPSGRWSAPKDLAGGEITLHEYRQIAAVAVPAYSPSDFVPVAWSDGERIWTDNVILERRRGGEPAK